MTTTVHKNLTGSDLHEPKGADSALAGTVYVANGSGSGVWVPASSVVTNTAFTTGDLKPTHKTSADASWIMWVDGTIGDGSSSASVRANADTAALFAVYWNGYSNTLCPVSGGRGANAAADFAAHKTITLPPGAGRAVVVAGSGSGLTTRVLGSTIGGETSVITTTNLPPYTPSGGVNFGSGFISPVSGATPSGVLSGGTFLMYQQGQYAAVAATFVGSAQGGNSTPLSVTQASAVVNMMIKL